VAAIKPQLYVVNLVLYTLLNKAKLEFLQSWFGASKYIATALVFMTIMPILKLGILVDSIIIKVKKQVSFTATVSIYITFMLPAYTILLVIPHYHYKT